MPWMRASSCSWLAGLLIRGAWSYVINGEVGDTNGARLLLGKLGHGLPGVDDGDVVVNCTVVLGGEGEEFRAALESHGPVNEVELRQLLALIRQSQGQNGAHIKVVKFELSKALVQSLFNVVGVVLAVPEFGGLGGQHCLSSCPYGCYSR